MGAPYSDYRVSDAAWVERIPAHWRTARLRYVARVGNGTTPSRDRFDYWSNGTVPWLASGQVNDYIVRKARELVTPLAVKESSLRVLPAGSVILGMVGQGKTRGMSAYLAIDATINQNLAGITPAKEIDGRYLHYMLTAAYDFQRNYGRGGNQAALNCAIVGRFPTLLPPRPEQDQIVAYLRAQDAHIARFIKAKRELIKLLTEQKLRIIDHTVTRGLNPSVHLKPSGIEWLGDVPEHWEISKVKLLADYINGFPFKPAEWGAKGRPIIRIQNLTKEHAAFNYYDGTIPERNHVKDGDILLSWSASLGVFVWNRGDAWLNQHIFKVVPDPKRITRGYFVWLARWFLNHMEAEAHGSTMQHITKPKFGSFPVPLPSLNEQAEIEAYINQETQDIDLAIARTEDEIKLIREYRDRLIADVVTGQVDVRGWQPGPDDVLAEEDLAALGSNEDIDTEAEDSDGEED